MMSLADGGQVGVYHEHRTRCAGTRKAEPMTVVMLMTVIAVTTLLSQQSVIAQTISRDGESTEKDVETNINIAFLEFLGLVSELDGVGLTTDTISDSSEDPTTTSVD